MADHFPKLVSGLSLLLLSTTLPLSQAQNCFGRGPGSLRTAPECIASLGLTKFDCTGSSIWCCELSSKFVKEPWVDYALGPQNVTTSCYYGTTDDSTTWYLRVKASGLPNHPYAAPVTVNAQNYDRLTELEPTLNLNKGWQNPYEFATLGGGPIGFFIHGVTIFSALTPAGYDAVYPPPGITPEHFDICEGHPQVSNSIYHHHHWPPCVFGWENTDPNDNTVYPIGNTNTAAYTSVYGNAAAKAAHKIEGVGYESLGFPSPIIGIAFDGWPVYGPYDANGSIYSQYDRDSCGGKILDDGTYAYFMSTDFPYIIGCFGPGWTNVTFTDYPTSAPSNAPNAVPTTNAPTKSPTHVPTNSPTHAPTKSPTQAPTLTVTSAPTKAPTNAPTNAPTDAPTHAPTKSPTDAPTHAPTKPPTRSPTNSPTLHPPPTPTHPPTHRPTLHPPPTPSHPPTHRPTLHPPPTPTHRPTLHPPPTPTHRPTLPPLRLMEVESREKSSFRGKQSRCASECATVTCADYSKVLHPTSSCQACIETHRDMLTESCVRSSCDHTSHCHIPSTSVVTLTYTATASFTIDVPPQVINSNPQVIQEALQQWLNLEPEEVHVSSADVVLNSDSHIEIAIVSSSEVRRNVAMDTIANDEHGEGLNTAIRTAASRAGASGLDSASVILDTSSAARADEVTISHADNSQETSAGTTSQIAMSTLALAAASLLFTL